MDVSCTDISKYSQPHITLFIQLLELQKIQGEKNLKLRKNQMGRLQSMAGVSV